MNAQQLKNAILQEAITGRLVPQDPNDEPASVLLDKIRKEKAKLVKEGKLKKKDLEEKPISKEEIPFEIPESWEWVRISDVTNVLMGQSPDGNDIYEAKEVNDAYEFHQGKICFTEKYITPSGKWCKNPSRIANIDSLLICVRAPIGDVNITKRAIGIGRGLAAMEGFGGILTIFLFYWMIAHKRCLVEQGTGSTFKAITVEVLKKQLIPLPPLAEQHRIVAKIEELLPKVEEYGKAQEALDKLNAELPERLKKSILQEAITGKLVPQDPNDEPASVLLDKIRKEKAKLVKEGKLKKKDLIETPISKDEIPFEIPESWEWCRLADYLDVRDGTHESPKYYSEGIPFVTSKNLDNGKIDFSTCKFIKEEDHKKYSERSLVEHGDILFAMIGSIGNPVIVNKDRAFSVKNVALFKRYNAELTSNKYIYYYLLFIQDELKKISSGGVQSFVGLKTLREWKFPLPPLAEQHRIVAKIEELLSKIDRLKTK